MTNDPVTDLRFALIAINEARRTLVVAPSIEQAARDCVAALDIEGLVTIKPCAWLPADTCYLIDEQALEANLREVLARPIKFNFGDAA